MSGLPHHVQANAREVSGLRQILAWRPETSKHQDSKRKGQVIIPIGGFVIINSLKKTKGGS